MGSFEAVVEICRAVRVVGGRGFVVGGGARDRIVGEGVSEDFDVEVFGVPGSEMIDVLSGRFAVDLVGETFAVVKLRGLDVDVSLPRRDSRAGIGHRGFTVEADPEMTVEEAAVRRDFTINSVYWDPLTDEYVDPCGGVADIGARVLRHTSESFAEDNLRVLRGRSSSPFRLEPAPETVELCRALTPDHLSRERVFEEFTKLVLRGAAPSLGLRFLEHIGWLRFWPELETMIGVEQDPVWHPEGDVWPHTLHCLGCLRGPTHRRRRSRPHRRSRRALP